VSGRHEAAEAGEAEQEAVGKLQFLREGMVKAAAEVSRPTHSPQGCGGSRFPMPVHLQRAGYEYTVNIAVLGAPGSGSSSLVNALRGKGPRDPVAAPVGSTRTTARPTAYEFCCEGHVEDNLKGEKEGSGTDCTTPEGFAAPVRLWDLPGVVGAAARENACKELGLLFYDVILVVCARRVTQGDVQLVRELSRWDVPYLIVRTKMDIDTRSEASDHGLPEEETLQLVRRGLAAQGFQSAFLVSARHPEWYEFRRLVANLLASVNARRRAGELVEDTCSICGVESHRGGSPHVCTFCEAGVCADCVELLSPEDGEAAHCPRCNQPSALRRTWSVWFWWLPSLRPETWRRWLWLLS